MFKTECHRLGKLMVRGGHSVQLQGKFTRSMDNNNNLVLIILTNVKMPTIVGPLVLKSMINTTSERLKARKVFVFKNFSFMSR